MHEVILLVVAPFYFPSSLTQLSSGVILPLKLNVSIIYSAGLLLRQFEVSAPVHFLYQKV